MTPDLENAVIMTMDGLNDLYDRAHDEPRKYTAGDAIVTGLGIVVVAGFIGGVGYAFQSIKKDEMKRSSNIESNMSEVEARIAELKAQLGE